MNDELFAELVESVREGGAILRGEKEPLRHYADLIGGSKTIVFLRGIPEKFS